MARRKTSNSAVRSLTRLGRGSIGLTLPIKLVRELGWRERQKVVVKKVRGGVQIKDWKK